MVHIIPVLRKLRQVDHKESKVSLGYKEVGGTTLPRTPGELPLLICPVCCVFNLGCHLSISLSHKGDCEATNPSHLHTDMSLNSVRPRVSAQQCS